MPAPITTATKLFTVLFNARQASGGTLTRERWIAVADEFLNVERPLVARTRRKTPLSRMSEEELITEWSSDPTYAGIDIRREIGKCKNYCKVNRLTPSPRRLINWMNRADQTLATHGAPSAARSAAISERALTPPLNWQMSMRSKIAAWKQINGEDYEPPGLTALLNNDFFGMPQKWREECWANDKGDDQGQMVGV